MKAVDVYNPLVPEEYLDTLKKSTRLLTRERWDSTTRDLYYCSFLHLAFGRRND